ncbi:hypothetical protein Tco_0140108 [Tanacetum coccineum]
MSTTTGLSLSSNLRDTLVDVNELGYPREVINLSNVTTNDMFEPWRALATIIIYALRERYQDLKDQEPQCYRSYGVLLIEITLIMLKGCGKNSLSLSTISQKTRGIWHSKLKERRKHYHSDPKPESLLHLPTEEPVLGNLKFSAKGTKREVFGMTIPNELINDVIRGSLVDEFVDEGVPAAKPRLEDTEEAIQAKKETDTGKLQPLPEVPGKEVPGKGKKKVGEEQSAQVLLNLQTPKKKSPTEQYIFQRRSHVPTETAGREDSTSLYAELGLSGTDTDSDEATPPGIRSKTQDEGQAGSDPGKPDEGQAGPNPDDVAESQPLPTPSVLAGPNLEHSEVEITDPSSQPQPEHMDEGFTAVAYPDVQENLKLTVDEQVIPEEPVSSTGTLSSLQHLAKDFSFGDQFLNDKPSEADNEKTTADTEAESMMSVTIQQDTSVIPPMTSPVIGLVPRPDSPNVHWPLPTTTTTTATTTTTLPLPPQPQQGPSDPILIKRMGELEEFIANLVEENQALETRLDKQGSRINKLETMDLPKMIREQTVKFIDSQEINRKINESVKEVVVSSVNNAMRAPLCARFKDLPTSDMKEILLQRMLEENYDKGHANHRVAYEALQDSIRRDESEDFDVDKAQEETKKKSKQDSPNTPPGSPPSPPPPPPPPSGASGASGTTGASDSAQAPPPPPPSSSTHQGDQSTSTAAPSSSKTAASAEYSAWTTTDTRIKPSITTIPDDLYMDDETTADEQAYSSGDEVGRDHIPTVNLRQSWWKPLTEDRPATPEPAWTIPSSDLTMPTNNWASALKSTYAPPPENSLLAQTGDMAIFMDWYYKRQGITHLTLQDLEGPAFEIVKVFHPDVIHLQFQMEECHKLLTDQVDDTILRLADRPCQSPKMKAAYYPDVGLEQLVPDQSGVEEEMQIRHRSYVLVYPSHWCFKDNDSYIDRFSSEGYRRAVRLPKRILSVVRIEVFSMYGYNYMKMIVLRRADLKEYIIAERDFKYMHPSDFEDPRKFRINEGQSMMNARFWTKKDVDRSKDFMFAIQKRLKTRRIFRNLERFVGGRIREGDYRLLQRTE